jgi:hypothetical protein
MKTKLTKEQKQALKAYNYAVQQEDRYMGGVFVSLQGQIDHEEKVKIAYQRCKNLGMTYEHGL